MGKYKKIRILSISHKVFCLMAIGVILACWLTACSGESEMEIASNENSITSVQLPDSDEDEYNKPLKVEDVLNEIEYHGEKEVKEEIRYQRVDNDIYSERSFIISYKDEADDTTSIIINCTNSGEVSDIALYMKCNRDKFRDNVSELYESVNSIIDVHIKDFVLGMDSGHMERAVESKFGSLYVSIDRYSQTEEHNTWVPDYKAIERAKRLGLDYDESVLGYWEWDQLEKECLGSSIVICQPEMEEYDGDIILSKDNYSIKNRYLLSHIINKEFNPFDDSNYTNLASGLSVPKLEPLEVRVDNSGLFEVTFKDVEYRNVSLHELKLHVDESDVYIEYGAESRVNISDRERLRRVLESENEDDFQTCEDKVRVYL